MVSYLTVCHIWWKMFCKVYQFGDVFRCVGIIDGKPSDEPFPRKRSPPDDVPVERAPEHISRARSRLRELALCNDWDFFVTLTLNPDKNDRSSLSSFKQKFNQLLKDYAKKYGVRPSYVFVPEQHKDGISWHMHGLMSGLSPQSLQKNEHGYLDIPYFRQRLGFLSLSKVRNHQKVASYITKYITKSLSATSFEAGEHMFIASNGLKGKELIFSGELEFPWQWCNDYVAIYEGNNLEEILKIGEKMQNEKWQEQQALQNWKW